MEMSKFIMLLEGRVFIPTLATLKGDADPREATLAARSEDYLPALFFEHDREEGCRKWLEARPPDGGLSVDQDRNDVLFRAWLRELSHRRAIWCWGSTNSLYAVSRGEPWENLAMWNSYARSGVAIKTDSQIRVREASRQPRGDRPCVRPAARHWSGGVLLDGPAAGSRQ